MRKLFSIRQIFTFIDQNQLAMLVYTKIIRSLWNSRQALIKTGPLIILINNVEVSLTDFITFVVSI